MPILRIIALDKFIEVFALQRIGLEGEVLVSPQVVDPKLLGPRSFTGWLLVEEENIGLDTLGVEQAGRQTQERMDLALVQELPANGLACPTFEEDIIGDDDRSTAVLLE